MNFIKKFFRKITNRPIYKFNATVRYIPDHVALSILKNIVTRGTYELIPPTIKKFKIVINGDYYEIDVECLEGRLVQYFIPRLRPLAFKCKQMKKDIDEKNKLAFLRLLGV